MSGWQRSGLDIPLPLLKRGLKSPVDKQTYRVVSKISLEFI
jgi:hypothetical protein